MHNLYKQLLIIKLITNIYSLESINIIYDGMLLIK